jgi:hypothetical protein
VCTAMAIVGCSNENSAAPPLALRQALDATVGADSFSVRSTIHLGERVSEGVVQYVAPDRYLIQAKGERFPSTIGVNGATYFSVPDMPGRYQRMESSCDLSIEEVVSFLEVLREARNVRFDGDTYRFEVPMLEPHKGEIEVEATLDGRFLATVRLRYRLEAAGADVEELHELGDFGSEFTIEPPDPDRVIDESDASVIVLDPPTPSVPTEC